MFGFVTFVCSHVASGDGDVAVEEADDDEEADDAVDCFDGVTTNGPFGDRALEANTANATAASCEHDSMVALIEIEGELVSSSRSLELHK